jgi:hypothetical protein
MNRLVSLAGVATVSLGVVLSGAAVAQSVPNTESGIKPLNLVPGSAEPTRGVVFFTAAINSDGTIASCFECAPANTKRLGVGQYQIDFGENVQAVKGWSRWRRDLCWNLIGGLRLDEDTWSGSKVNRLIGEFLGQALPSIDFAHGDLT